MTQTQAVHPSASIPLILRRKFDEIRGKNPAFSLRAFAKKLYIHPAALSEILNGKRTVSTKLASRLVKGLDLDEKEREQILSLAAGSHLLKGLKRKRAADSTQLGLDRYFLVSEWHYYAILSLAETRDFQGKASWIAERLGLPEATAESALDRLARLGYFTRERDSFIPRQDVRLSTANDVSSDALKRRHELNLKAAQDAVRAVPVELREFTSMTMAIDVKKLPLAKAIIREFRENLCAFLENGDKSEVFELCISLFPRSVVRDSGEKKR